jgi:hypothetical protein
MVAPALAGQPQEPPLQLDFFTASNRRGVRFHNVVGSLGPVILLGVNDQGWPGKEPKMSIIGCDLHSRYQVIAMLDTETGEASLGRHELKESSKDEALEKAPVLRPGSSVGRAGSGVKGRR